MGDSIDPGGEGPEEPLETLQVSGLGGSPELGPIVEVRETICLPEEDEKSRRSAYETPPDPPHDPLDLGEDSGDVLIKCPSVTYLDPEIFHS